MVSNTYDSFPLVPLLAGILVFNFFGFGSYAQEFTTSATSMATDTKDIYEKNIIEKAMEDELQRSMDELAYKDYEKPFFISYTINDSKAVSISASLGALLYSNHIPVRNKSIRVMVGDYDFNDESLDASYYDEASGMSEISIPIENDYFGIRRSLWVSTDAVYKSAAKLFQDNKQYLKEKDITLENLPHRRFARAPIVKLAIEKEQEEPNINNLENFVKEISSVFSTEPDIHHSMVTLSFINNTNYFISSEGTRIKYPYSIATIQIYAEIKTEDGESIYDQLSHFSFTATTLPSKAALKEDVKGMIANLKTLKETKVFKDSYLGPVLFVEDAVGSVFSSSLFGFEGLITSNDISIRDNFQYNGQFLDDKIGKRILADGLMVQSMPKLKYYNEIPLPGTFEVDAEGVVPKDTLTLVQDGLLMALLNSRTTTRESHSINGHSNSSQGMNPGVIKVSYNNRQSIAELKQKLIDNAKDDGLPYAIMIKRIPYGNYMAVNIYKVNLENGKEELLRLAQVNPLTIRSLRRIQGSGNEHIVFNSQGHNGLSSYIVPNGLLVDEVEVEGSSAPFLGRKNLVDNPLKTRE